MGSSIMPKMSIGTNATRNMEIPQTHRKTPENTIKTHIPIANRATKRRTEKQKEQKPTKENNKQDQATKQYR